MKKEIKIMNHPWHLGHQYELMKTPNTKWYWLDNHRRSYSDMPRGDMIKKFNIEWVSEYEPGKYDLAILHLDQQCLEDSLLRLGKGSLYMHLNKVITDIPKIVICHGTPYYPEKFPCDITEDNYKELGFTEKQIGMSSILINKFKEVTKGNTVVVNSERAAEEWGIGTPIIHGLDEEEWWNLHPKEPRVMTVLSPGGLDKYYDRKLLQEVKDLLLEKNITHCHVTVDLRCKDFDEYRKFIGTSLIHFYPTLEAPMGRARSECMLSGCCTVTTKNHDIDKYIEDGISGIFVNRNPKKIADLIELLIDEYKTAYTIGQEGRKAALKHFNGERYRKDWTNLINKVLKK